MENASQAFLAATRGSMRRIRAKLETTAIDPELLTAAERLQYEGYLHREDVNASVLALPNVNVGYITRHKLLLDHLRKRQQDISSLMSKTVAVGQGRPRARLAA